MILVQTLILALSNASVYLVLAASLSLIFGILYILNFAQGDFMTIGAYISYVVLATLGGSTAGWIGSFALLIATGVVVGTGFYVGLVSPLRRHEHYMQLVGTYGLALLIQGVLFLVFGGQPASAPRLVGSFVVGGATLTHVTILNGLLAVGSIAALGYVLNRTELGREIRATSQDRTAAQMTGISTVRVEVIAVLLSVVLAMAGGVMLSQRGNLQPTVGFESILKGFAIVIVAGMGTALRNLVLVAIGLATVEALIGTYVSNAITGLVFFVAIIATLIVRPQGVGTIRMRDA